MDKKIKIKTILRFVCAIAVGLLLSQTPVSADEIRVAIIDSGATGYVDDGVSFTSYPANRDPLNHGTQVAKLIRQGAPDAKIFMLQVCDKINGKLQPSQKAILQAIKWCTKNKIRVVNLSLVATYDKKIEQAINNAATSHGVLFVAAAGNRTIESHFASDSDGYIYKATKSIKPAFPASSSSVIAVGGLDPSGKIASYSGTTCDIYANGKILGEEGSSFACARVTAKAAQVLSRYTFSTKETLLSHLR